MMKYGAFICLTLALVFVTACSSSSKLSKEELNQKNYEQVYGLIDVSEVDEKPEQMPKYPNGNGGLIADIQKHRKYPETAIAENIEGNVIVGFTVNKKGEVEKLSVERSVHPALDQAALDVMQKLQPWYPAYTDGEAVPVRLKTMVTFRQPIQSKEITQ